MNITHVKHLFRAYLIENKKWLLIFCLVIFGMFTWGFSVSAMPEIAPVMPFIFTFVIASRFFQPSQKKSNATHFFTLPVTAGSKIASAISIILIFGIIFHIIGFAGAYTGRFLIRPMLFSDIMELTYRFNLRDLYVMTPEWYLFYAVVTSVFLFGSIYFKKNAFWKTTACGIGFLMSVALYNLLLQFIAFGTWELTTIDSGISFDLISKMNIFHISFYGEYIAYGILSITTLFFLFLTWLRLKETEV